MDQISPLPVPSQDELRVAAWAEVREPLERQLAPLGRRALAALAPRPGESVLDIGCGGGETTLELAGLIAPDGTVVGIDLSAAVLMFAQRAAKGCERVRFVQADAQAVSLRTGCVRRRVLAVWGDVLRRSHCGVHQYSS